MNRRLRAAFDVLIRLMLVAGLAYTPLAQSFAMAAMATPPAAAVSGGCPHHAESMSANSDQPQSGGCCTKKGSACHCAMTVALPTSALPATAATGSEHPVSVPRLTASILPTPEPPPPRG